MNERSSPSVCSIINENSPLLNSGGKNIVYVMAFKSNLANNVNIKDNINIIKSNIAKYSLIQCVRDMNSLNYPIKIIEIMRP